MHGQDGKVREDRMAYKGGRKDGSVRKCRVGRKGRKGDNKKEEDNIVQIKKIKQTFLCQYFKLEKPCVLIISTVYSDLCV